MTTTRPDTATLDTIRGLEIKVVDNRPTGGSAHVQMGYTSGMRFSFDVEDARRAMNALRRAIKLMED